ncbi:hypothetical protein C4564_02540 [Candidatus Microgenomates bacterium]|nr:MAG: hypothetical protein C4564_02540 [Candidatus Microgenomates bacterium]
MKHPSRPIIFSLTIGIIFGFVTSSLLGSSKQPKNCSEIGQVYLEIAKLEKNITDYSSDEWIKIVDDETRLINDCHESLQ